MVVRRVVKSAGLFAVVGLGLGACGMGAGTADGGDLDASDLGDVEGEIVFQTMQLSPTFDELITGMIEEFEAEHPDVKVEWIDVPSDGAARKINADAASGRLPDVLDLDVDTLALLANDGRVLDMEEVTPQIQEEYVASAWDSFEFDGVGAAALPWYLNSPVLIMNDNLLRDAGLDPADPPATYPELMDHARTVRQETSQAGFQPTVSRLPNIFLAHGVPLVDEAGRGAVLDTPEALQVLEELRDLVAEGAIPAESLSTHPESAIEAFQEGHTAYFESGITRFSVLQENAPELYESVSVAPPLQGGDWVVAHGLAVAADTDAPAAAVEFALHVTNGANQLALAKESSVFPSHLESLADTYFTEPGTAPEDEARATIGENLVSGKGSPAKPAAIDAEFEQELYSELQLALLGDEDPARALQRAEGALSEVLASE